MATDLLAAEPDQFGGVIVAADLLPADADEVSASLDRSLTTSRTDGKRLVLLEGMEHPVVSANCDSRGCFRHWHGSRYGKSDIYFVGRLSPLSEDVTMQAEEIEECFWMPIDDYFSSDFVSVFNKRIVRAALASPGVTPEWIDGYADPARYEFFMPRED